MVQIHEHGTEYCLSDDKVAAALARVKKLQRREPSQLPPCRRLQLTGVGCEPRDPPGLCRSRKPLNLPHEEVKLMNDHLASNGTMRTRKSSGLREGEVS